MTAANLGHLIERAEERLASYYLDTPTGPAVVVVLGLMLVATWLMDMMSRRRQAQTTEG